MSSLVRPRAVTFDCWSTLLYEPDPTPARLARARLLAEAAGVDAPSASDAITRAWRHHSTLWHRRIAFTGRDMTRMALDALGVSLDDARLERLVADLEGAALQNEVRVVDGAREVLEALVSAGVRRALVCDTGFSPGRTVRALLGRVGLLDLLETCAFSDEVGVPKPDPAIFDSVLGELGVTAAEAVHVGDLRRSDVAGARARGMGSVRVTVHHDDTDFDSASKVGVLDCVAAGCAPPCPRPEADAVVARYSELLGALGLDPNR